MKIGSVQINNSFSGQSYLPYATCMLQSYILAHHANPESLEFTLPIFSRVKVEDAVEALVESDLVLFSTYVWNIRLSLAIAEALKKAKPEIKILFGGPQVPDVGDEFLKKNRFIDIAVHGEGERVLLDVVNGLVSGEWRSASGLSYINENGEFVQNPKATKMRNLDCIPSPFLTGLFDPVMEAYPDMKWIALWETNRGCPYACTYCDWGSDTNSKVTRFDMDRLFRELEWFAEKKIEFIFCCDANFGIMRRDLELAEYAAKVKAQTGYPKALSVQNTKNATDRSYQVQKVLSDAGLNKGVALSVQSMNYDTLVNVKRENISNESYMELQRRFTKDRVETYSDYILAMPGDTWETTINGITELMERGQHNRIQFNNLSILPNAEMGDPKYQEKFGMVTVQTDIINIHGSLDAIESDITEFQDLVVATKDMPIDDWVKTRTFCWLTALLHFDKVFQMPIILTRKLADISYKEIMLGFFNAPKEKYPVLGKIINFFFDEARLIQKGGAEYKLSKEYLNIFWPHDEYVLIHLIASGEVVDFYNEAFELLKELMGADHASLFPIIEDAVDLNRKLLKLPFQIHDLTVNTKYNVWEVYRAALWSEDIPIEEVSGTYHIDRTSHVWNTWDDFCREVIWWGNKKGAYLYTVPKGEPTPAGIY